MELPHLDIREKLRVECPDILKQAGLVKVDFGTLFLNPTDEAVFGKIQDTANNALQIIENADKFISKEAAETAKNAITYIIKDLLSNLEGYVRQTFNTYISPEYPVKLATTLVKESLRYTQMYTENPAKLLMESESENDNQISIKIDSDKEKAIKNTIKKINGVVSKVLKKIKEIVDEIEPYIKIISRIMIYGPSYVASELNAIYVRYRDRGISYINEQLGKLNAEIAKIIDNWAETIGYKSAEKINEVQRKAIQKIKKEKDKVQAKIKVKAMYLINQTKLNLMAMLGA